MFIATARPEIQWFISDVRPAIPVPDFGGYPCSSVAFEPTGRREMRSRLRASASGVCGCYPRCARKSFRRGSPCPSRSAARNQTEALDRALLFSRRFSSDDAALSGGTALAAS